MFNSRGRQSGTERSFRGRSGSRGKFSYRGGFNSKRNQERKNKKAEKIVANDDQVATPVENNSNPNVTEKTKRIEVKGYEIKDAEISGLFRDWIEPDRKNILITLDDKLEDRAIETYQPKVEITIQDKRQEDKLTGLKNVFTGGMKLSLGIRILRTLSQTQRLKVPKLQEIVQQIKDFEIPNSLNIIFGQVGKFTDESFGNGRIIGGNLVARRKIIESCKLMDTYSTNTNWNYIQHEDWKKIMNGNIDIRNLIWKDTDSLEWMKIQGAEVFESLNNMSIKLKYKENSDIYIRYPNFNFESKSMVDLHTYLKQIKDMDFVFENYDQVDFGYWNGRNARDTFGAFALVNCINGEFFKSKLSVGAFYDILKDTFLKDIGMKEILEFFNLTDAGLILSNDDVVGNAFEAFSIYNQRMYPLIKNTFKMTNLDNSEFGSISQVIEVDESEKHRKWSNNTDFSSISAFKNKTQVVLGGLIGYSKHLYFKRSLQGHLSANRGNIYGKLTSLDNKD